MVAHQVFQKLFLLLPLAYPNTTPAPSQPSPNWSYDDTQAWGNNFPQCNGNRQSPIHLKSASTYILPLRPLKFANYDLPLRGAIALHNNGHSVELDVPVTINGQRPYISGGTLKSKFEAVGVHFHWGSNGFKGSEHVIDNRRFDVEMHIVHKNVRYPTVAEATRHSDGIAVLGIMFKITDNIDRYYPGLNKIFNQLPALVQYNATTPIKGEISLGQLLGDLNTKNFFTYSGSLTTPDCAEAVTWHVFAEPLPIASEHIRKFWNILDANGQLLLDNFRPLQRRNNRPVFYRVPLSEQPNFIHY